MPLRGEHSGVLPGAKGSPGFQSLTSGRGFRKSGSSCLRPGVQMEPGPFSLRQRTPEAQRM